MALTPRQLAVIRARARAKKGQPAAALTYPTALGGLGYQPEEEASRREWRQGAANVAVPTAPAPKPPSRLSAAAGQFAQSATLGQAPNILALPNAPSGQFAEAKKFYQQRLMQGSQEFPVTTGAADIAGFFAPGGAALKGVTTVARPLIKAVQEAPAIIRGASKIAGGAALGATEGALYGGTVQAERQAMEAGQAAPTMQQRGEAAAPAAAMGAVVGGALPIAGRVLKPVGTAIAGQTAKLMGPGATRRQAERVAQKAVRADLQRAGINNLDDFLKAAEQYRGKPAMTGELAQSTLNTLTALVRGKGTTGDKVQAILADRVAGFPARMMRDLEASTGLKADEILGDIDAMVKAGREIATPQYDIAKAAPFKVSEKLQSLIDRSPTVQQAVEAARGVIADKAAAAGKSVDEIPPLEFYDEVKQQIDRIEFSGRKMGDRETRQIDEVRRAFVQALDEIVPGAYAAARKAGGEAPKIREAVKLGQNSYTKPLEQVVADIAGMGEPALKAYRGAFVTNLVNKIRMGQLKPAALRSPNLRDKMATLFGEDAADQLVTKFSQEFDLLKKGSRLDPNVGSVTSQALLGASDQALDDILNAGSQAVSIARSLASGQLSGVIGPALNYFRRAGYTEAQLNAIGDLLASDPQRAAKILFPNEMARLGGTPGGAAANVLANPPQPPSGGRNTLATPYELGGALTGGAIGATQGETPEERARNALLGAAGGAVAGRIARKAPLDRTATGSNLGNVLAPETPQGPRPNQMGLYSQLEAAIARPNAPGKASGEAWAAWLKSQPGVKQSEIEATGVNDWLRAKEGQVTRADVENYVRNNGVQVDEVTYSRRGATGPSGEQMARERFELEWAERQQEWADYLYDDARSIAARKYKALPEDQKDLYDDIDQFMEETGGVWGQYTPEELNIAKAESWNAVRVQYEQEARRQIDEYAPGVTRDKSQDPTKWSSFTLPGGENYTELLLKLPETRSKEAYWASHWSEPNVLAHVRFKERTGPKGERILALEEVQSDWHQAGRRQGYGGNIPDAPFKNNAWAALAMKRIVKYAADNGFDGVAWVPGNIQNGKLHRATDNRADFYDKIFVNIANDIGKKSGVRAERLTLDTAPANAQIKTTDFHYLPLTGQLKKQALEQGFPLFSIGAIGAGTAAAGAMQTRDKKTPRREPRG